MLAELYERRPLRFAVTVDGRPIGSLYNTSMVAELVAEELYHEAPWTVVEVTATYVAN